MKQNFIYFFLFLSLLPYISTRIIINKSIKKRTIKEINNQRKLIDEYKKLNNIINIYYPEGKVYFISSITKNENLFILTNNAQNSNVRVIYAIKSDGTKFFEDTNLHYKIINCDSAANNTYPKLTFYNIKGKEYLATYSQGSQFELIDFKKNIVYYTFHYQVINYIPHVHKDIFFSLQYYNNSQYIINAFMSRKDSALIIHKISYDSILKNKMDASEPIKLTTGYKASSINCFEIKDFIECLFLNQNGFYIIIILDITNLDVKFGQQIETNKVSTDYLFSNCIYFKDNIGAFIYFINNDSSPKLLFKELIIPTNLDSEFILKNFFSSIIINSDRKFNLDNTYLYNNIIKRNENSIYYISLGKTKEEIIVVLIRFLNNYKSLLILYYDIKLKEYNNMKIFTDFTCFILNKNLGIGMVHYDYSKSYTNTYSSYFIIGNAVSYDYIIQDDIDIFDKENIYEFKIEKIKIVIDNNIFGNIFKGIQIISDINEDNLGFNLYSKNKQNYLQKNDFLTHDDIINFKIVNSLGVKLGNYSIEFIPIISEINYEELNTIYDSVEYFSNDGTNFNSFYQPETFQLKKTNILFSVNHCYKTCEKCFYHGDENNHKCEKCSSNYPYYIIDEISNNFNCFELCPENYTSDKSDNFLCIKKAEDIIIDSTQNEAGQSHKFINFISQKIASESLNNFISHNINWESPNTIYFENESKYLQNASTQKCYESLPYEIIENRTCVSDCKGKDFFEQICKISYKSFKTIEHILDNIRKEIINHSMDTLLINVTNENKIDLFIREENELYQITSSYNQKNKEYNISTIKLGICEDILKHKYNITLNNTLIILKIDYNIEGLYIPIIEYEVYHPDTKERLNLDYCEKEDINIEIPIIIDKNELFKYNSSSAYFNDRCFPYTSKYGTDITLNDRRNEYNNNNMSLCEENCKLIEYNSDNQKVTCKCNIKKKFHLISDIYLDSDLLLNKITDFKSNINFEVVKCYKKLFTKEGILYNIGSYILLTIIIAYIILMISFFAKGYNSFFSAINKIIIDKKEINNLSKNKGKNNNNKLEKIKNKLKTETGKKTKAKIVNNFPPKKKKELKYNKNISFSTTNRSVSKVKMMVKNNLLPIKGNNKSIKKKGQINNIEIHHLSKNKKKNNIKHEFLDIELNLLMYIKAIKYDKRTYLQYYFSLLKIKHILLRINSNDYNSKIIKACLLLFKFSLYFMVNALFFSDSTMHKIYEDEGEYNFIYQCPLMIYSTIICTLFNYLITYFSSSQREVLELKNEKSLKLSTYKYKKLNKYLTIKFILFYALSFIFLFFFWFYISCFCMVYTNTQVVLIEDTFISFGLSLIYPLLYNLIPGIFRIPSLKSEKKDKECMYKISRIFQLV